MADLLTEMTDGRKSVQQINTSLDDDCIDMLNSSKLQRYFGVEIESQPNTTRKPRKHKIKHLFGNNQKNKDNKTTGRSRRSRRKIRKRQNTKYNPDTPQSLAALSKQKSTIPNSNTNHIKSRHKSKDKSGRSRSVPRIPPMDQMNNNNHHDNLSKKYRLASWFEKFNRDNHKPMIPRIDTNVNKNSNNNNNYNNCDVITPASITSTNTTMSTIYTPSVTRNGLQRITWRPSLKDIHIDKPLLTSLIAFMERIYCEENILFLQAVQQFKCKIDQYIDSDEKQSQIECNLTDNIKRDIDFQIHSVYNAYIVSNAEYQVNLSYENLMNSLGRREAVSTLTLHQKREIFDNCVDEIERLIMSSVLSPFYDSAEFAVVAHQRPRSNGIGTGNILQYNRDSITIKKKMSNTYGMESNDSGDDNEDTMADNMDSGSDGFDDLIMRHNTEDSEDSCSMPRRNNIIPLTGSLYTSKTNDTTPPMHKLIEGMSQSAKSLFDFEKIQPKVENNGSSKSIASAPGKRKDSGVNSYNYLSSYPQNGCVISPISTTNDINDINIIDNMNYIPSHSPISLSQSKSEQFDLSNSFCSPDPNNKYMKHKLSDPVRLKHNKEQHNTYSDADLWKQFKVQKLKYGDDGSNNRNSKKYMDAKTKKYKDKQNKKDKKRLKKKKKKQLAMDDGKIKHTSQRKNKIKKLKKSKKIRLRKRRKSNNDSDILLMLYRENHEKTTNNNDNDKQNKNDNIV